MADFDILTRYRCEFILKQNLNSQVRIELGLVFVKFYANLNGIKISILNKLIV